MALDTGPQVGGNGDSMDDAELEIKWSAPSLKSSPLMELCALDRGSRWWLWSFPGSPKSDVYLYKFPSFKILAGFSFSWMHKPNETLVCNSCCRQGESPRNKTVALSIGLLCKDTLGGTLAVCSALYPWTGQPGGLWPGPWGIRRDWAHTHTYMCGTRPGQILLGMIQVCVGKPTSILGKGKATGWVAWCGFHVTTVSDL